ncbi:MAG: universal stress protein [Desulfobacteraceae bacterium]|nr:universal stress protein [Desulfobacteraceae bacterium]
MFKHLLVPLDGSILAEVVLPAAAYLAQACHSRVTVIHIIEQDAPPAVHGERHLTNPQEAEAYLAEIGRRFFPAQIKQDYHVHTSAMKDVAAGIVLHQSELAPDLVVMGTHGRGGLRDLLFGRIAQQVVAAGNLPVLLIRPEAASEGLSFNCRRILAPTDGDPEHALGLQTAFNLARILGAQLDLLGVVPTLNRLTGRTATASRFAPGTSQAMLEIAEADLGRFLQRKVADFRKAGVNAGARLERGDPAAIIAGVAEKINVDLIAFSTHGKSGAAAFWNQSIGAKVLAQTRRPMLMVPV